MDNSVQVNKILSLFRELDDSTRRKLLHVLASLVKSEQTPENSEEEHSLLDLAGLGAEIWEGVDPDEYVRKLREEWD